ncbi:MAG: site-specific DNA-methyltransferase [Thermoplasmata archaeon]|nr:site-specific DNA-methyltransferase [Thermoplasmata archaeon]
MSARGPRNPAPGAPYANLTSPSGSPILLWHEDSLAGTRLRLRPKSVDVVVTSPPYNLGVRYGAYRDDRPFEEYLAWIGRLRDAVDLALAPQGSFFLNVGGPPRDPGRPWRVAQEVGERFVLQNVIHWVKSIALPQGALGRSSGVTRDLAVGHYKPVNSPRYLHGAHEYIFHFTRHGDVGLDRLAIGVPYQDTSNVTRWRGAGRGVRCRGNTWFLPYPTIRYRRTDRPHPASFPPELPERCVRLHGLARVRLVLDPFVGIGPSAEAALRLGVPFVGFDVDEAYLAEARRRLHSLGAVPAAPPVRPRRSRRASPARGLSPGP